MAHSPCSSLHMLLSLMLLISFFHPFHAISDDVLRKICQGTQNPDLCIDIFISNRVQTKDLYNVASAGLDYASSYGQASQQVISDATKLPFADYVVNALKECAVYYADVILFAPLNEATNSLSRKDYKSVQSYILEALKPVNDCDHVLSPYSDDQITDIRNRNEELIVTLQAVTTVADMLNEG